MRIRFGPVVGLALAMGLVTGCFEETGTGLTAVRYTVERGAMDNVPLDFLWVRLLNPDSGEPIEPADRTSFIIPLRTKEFPISGLVFPGPGIDTEVLIEAGAYYTGVLIAQDKELARFTNGRVTTTMLRLALFDPIDENTQDPDADGTDHPDADAEPCTPSCGSRVCGFDECGNPCGRCNDAASCVDGLCVCDHLLCGYVCCGEGAQCTNGQCCMPDCGDRECGIDACGQDCGECEVGVCEGGKCVEHCPVGWWESATGGRCYQGGAPQANFHAASAACAELDAHLATLTSAEEEAELRAGMGNRLATYWIGGTDEGDEGQWRWETGEAWDYENWCDGAPDNLEDSEHWLVWDTVTGCWNDAPLTAPYGHHFICELN